MKLEWHTNQPSDMRNLLATDGYRLFVAFFFSEEDGWYVYDYWGWYRPANQKVIAWAELPNFPKIGEEIPEASDETR